MLEDEFLIPRSDPVPGGLHKQFPVSFFEGKRKMNTNMKVGVRKAAMRNLSLFWLVVVVVGTCWVIPEGSQAASTPVVTDFTKPGVGITFSFSTGTRDLRGSWLYRTSTDNQTWGNWTSTQGTLSGVNNTASTTYFQFKPDPSNSEKPTDWHQTIWNKDGTSQVYSGNIQSGSPWAFYDLDTLPDVNWRIPDLAPVSGGNPNLTIYTAVNLDLYYRDNPLGFLNGGWSEGQTLGQLGLTISDGVIPGVQGIYWATSEFVFDSDPSGPGFVPSGGLGDLLNSDTYSEPIGIIAEHSSIPEPGTWGLVALGGLVLILSRRLRSAAERT